MKYILVLFLFISVIVKGQNTIKGNFKGWWASTSWEYEFKENNTFTFKSLGHFGNTFTSGKYKMIGDTIFLNSKKTRNILNNSIELNDKKLLIDGDSCIIDFYLRFDYCNSNIQKRYYEFEPGVKSEMDHNSRIRNIKYPQVKAKTTQEIENLIQLLNIALNDSNLAQYYHFENTSLGRKPIIASYFELKQENELKIYIKNQLVEFIPESEICDKFYIKIEDINMNEQSISIELSIKEESVDNHIFFEKDLNGLWKLKSNRVNEN
ncbi:MAG: hypothetical protein ACPGSD_01805 [Flavobacteriales bacterium]